MPPFLKAILALVASVGATALGFSLLDFQSADPVRYLCYLVVAILASGLKVAMPTLSGTLSVNFLFVLVGILELSLPETVMLACAATVVEALWRPGKPVRVLHVLYGSAAVATAVAGAHSVYHSAFLRHRGVEEPIMIALAAAALFLLHSLATAVLIAGLERGGLFRTWRVRSFWTLPYYLVGAGIAGVYHLCTRLVGWQTSSLILPAAYLLYRAYRLYEERLDDQMKHSDEMSSVHLRTIEALALAIEAKDHTTHGHLQRVQVYAIEIGKELGLAEAELEALRAASVLHDIGKLAVPEHIISKPGRLTPEEFEKMKIHPVVGAEILEQVQFPYPVAPIVRSHHERWDGAGYPSGLKGEEIPIGARILSAIDCLDALATDRQYRRALPLEEAMNVVARDAGKAFDPRVVEVLERRHVQLEQMASARQDGKSKLSSDARIERGEAPAAGFEASRPEKDRSRTETVDFLSCIAAARQEVHTLFELAQDLGASLSLDETLSVLAVRLQRVVPYESMAIYVQREGVLHPAFVTGENFRVFSSLEIPVGEGLTGWVVENRKPIVNGNPGVEPGYGSQAGHSSVLRSALAVPLEGLAGVVGALALYRAEKDAFTRDHLRILLAISGKVALSVENALKYKQAESSATTDYLTGLPNARSLFLHLDGEVSRSRRQGHPLSLLVCDLDHFKQVNDRFGHLEGNRVLKAVASALRAGCREYDYVARMGGDEFVLILPGIFPQDAQAKAGRLSAIAELAAQQACGESICTLSVGTADYPADGADAEQLLSVADRRMYAAKQNRKASATPARSSFELGWNSSVVQ
ncbi:MAG: diguanylate cyclase [Acidobacteria bacterium]|nr:diguanylate cyclase [Acidobacteriota bacterium]